MEITLRSETAERVRQTLGADVDLAPEAAPAALARLSVEAPDVYAEVMAEISGTQIQLDSERARARKRRSAAWRRRLFGWGEYQSDAGDRLIAKRHVAAAVPLGLAGLLLLVLCGSALFGHRQTAPVHPKLAVTTVPARVQKIAPAVLPSVRLPALPPFPNAAGSVPWNVAAGNPVLPPARASLPRDPLVLTFDSTPPSRGGVPSAPHASAAVRPDAPVSPIVYDRSTEGTPVAADAPALSTSGPEPEAGKILWTVGQRVPARLATGIVAASSGPPTPVVAETSDPAATWLGEATLGPDGRVQVTFALAGAKGGARGVALNPAHLIPGLTGSTTLRQPGVAAAALMAATQAAASYARALAQQGQVAVSNDWAELAWGQAGPAWTYLAASLADGIAPRTGTSGPVETSEIAAGTPLLILVTEGQ